MIMTSWAGMSKTNGIPKLNILGKVKILILDKFVFALKINIALRNKENYAPKLATWYFSLKKLECCAPSKTFRIYSICSFEIKIFFSECIQNGKVFDFGHPWS